MSVGRWGGGVSQAEEPRLPPRPPSDGKPWPGPEFSLFLPLKEPDTQGHEQSSAFACVRCLSLDWPPSPDHHSLCRNRPPRLDMPGGA